MARRRPRTEEPNLFALRCDECGRQLETTPSGYLACPLGHGKLRADVPPLDPEPSGLWFGDEPPDGGGR
jgi:hypothetical protein